MAQKRMFSVNVIESDEFIEMSDHAKALYLYLVLKADDDGFINNIRTLIRFYNSDDEGLQELVKAGFIIQFDEKNCVIVHWKQQNSIAKDRYKRSNNEFINRVNLNDNNMYTECLQDDNKMYTECKRSIDKNRIDKINTDKNSIEKNSDSIVENSIYNTSTVSIPTTQEQNVAINYVEKYKDTLLVDPSCIRQLNPAYIEKPEWFNVYDLEFGIRMHDADDNYYLLSHDSEFQKFLSKRTSKNLKSICVDISKNIESGKEEQPQTAEEIQNIILKYLDIA